MRRCLGLVSSGQHDFPLGSGSQCKQIIEDSKELCPRCYSGGCEWYLGTIFDMPPHLLRAKIRAEEIRKHIEESALLHMRIKAAEAGYDLVKRGTNDG